MKHKCCQNRRLLESWSKKSTAPLHHQLGPTPWNSNQTGMYNCTPFKLELQRGNVVLLLFLQRSVCISSNVIHTKPQTSLCILLFCCFLVHSWKEGFYLNSFLRRVAPFEVCLWISHSFYFSSRWILFLGSLFMASEYCFATKRLSWTYRVNCACSVIRDTWSFIAVNF